MSKARKTYTREFKLEASRIVNISRGETKRIGHDARPIEGIISRGGRAAFGVAFAEAIAGGIIRAMDR